MTVNEHQDFQRSRTSCRSLEGPRECQEMVCKPPAKRWCEHPLQWCKASGQKGHQRWAGSSAWPTVETVHLFGGALCIPCDLFLQRLLSCVCSLLPPAFAVTALVGGSLYSHPASGSQQAVTSIVLKSVSLERRQHIMWFGFRSRPCHLPALGNAVEFPHGKTRDCASINL